MPKNTTQCPRPGLEPGPLAPESSALTMRPPIINYDLDITNILVLSPQIRYIEVFDITNPPFNEQIWPVHSDFVKSRFHCISKVTRHHCSYIYTYTVNILQNMTIMGIKIANFALFYYLQNKN